MICDHTNMLRYSGKIPCIGYIICDKCGEKFSSFTEAIISQNAARLAKQLINTEYGGTK